MKSDMSTLQRVASLSPVKIAGGYLLFGGMWILLSDSLVDVLVQRQGLATQIQTVKGWVFVSVSAILLLGLIRTYERQLQHSRNRLSRATEELHVLHRIYRHNIRNDLNVVRGYIDLIRNKIEDADIKQQLNNAHDSTARILGVSEKLRMIEVANTRAANTDTVDVMEIINQEAVRFRAEYPDVTLDVEGPTRAWIYGDQSLAYVVRELFDNAVEHHEKPAEHCRIDVRVDRSVSEVSIVIEDNGPGISTYEIRALEEGDESQLLHSSGIGLWLVKWLCLFYDGAVTFEQLPADGTLVTLTFEPSIKLDQVIEQAWDELPLQASA